MNKAKKVISVGQVSVDGSQGGMVYSEAGIAQTLCACTHGYAIGYVLKEVCNENKADSDIVSVPCLEYNDSYSYASEE